MSLVDPVPGTPKSSSTSFNTEKAKQPATEQTKKAAAMAPVSGPGTDSEAKLNGQVPLQKLGTPAKTAHTIPLKKAVESTKGPVRFIQATLSSMAMSLFGDKPVKPVQETLEIPPLTSDDEIKKQIRDLSNELNVIIKDPKCGLFRNYNEMFIYTLEKLLLDLTKNPLDPRFVNEQIKLLRRVITDLTGLLVHPPETIEQQLKMTKNISTDINNISLGIPPKMAYTDFIKALKDPWQYPRKLQTLLHRAAMTCTSSNSSLIILNALIEVSGLDINVRDESGNTPLHWAVANAMVSCALELIKYPNLDYNAQDWGFKNQTALQLAIAKGRRTPDWSELVTTLISHTQLDLLNKDGNSALHLAYARRDVDWINALIAAGANPNIGNNKGQMPAELWDLDNDTAYALMGPSPDTTTWDVDARNQANREAIRL